MAAFQEVLLMSMTRNHKALEIYLTKNVFDVIGPGKRPSEGGDSTNQGVEPPDKAAKPQDLVRTMEDRTRELIGEDVAFVRAQNEAGTLIAKIRLEKANQKLLLEREQFVKQHKDKVEPLRAAEGETREIVKQLEDQRRRISGLIEQFNKL